MKEIKLKAFAKINLNLKIKKKLKNRYHVLDSVFAAIDLADLIKVGVYREQEIKLYDKSKYENRILITSSSESMPKGKSNIVFKMVKYLRQKEKFNHYVKISIRKNIPIGAGLGGGSSDAAVVYMAIKKLLKTKAQSNSILAKKIGADVPFFLKGGTARVRGIGEKVEKIKYNKKVHIVLVNPNYKISTKWAYEKYDKLNKKKNNKKAVKISSFENIFNNAQVLNSGNDLEKVIFKKHPKLRSIKKALINSGAYFAALSGSGPTIFGLFKNKEKARKAVLHFESKGLWAKYTKPINKL